MLIVTFSVYAFLLLICLLPVLLIGGLWVSNFLDWYRKLWL